MSLRSSLVFAGLALALSGCGSSSSGGAATTSPGASGSGGAAGSGGVSLGGSGGDSSSAGASGSAGDSSSAGAAGLGGTSGSGGDPGGAGTSGTGTATTMTVGGARPTKLYVPPSYDPSVPMPLLVMLHGYSASGLLEEAYLQLEPQAEAQGFLYVHPDGTFDSMQKRFWNATDACCNIDGSSVDDEGYLLSLLDEIESKVSVDPKRVYFMGHSNGGFMSYRMACHHADRIAAIGVLAGEMYENLADCGATAPVSLLHMQGTADQTISFTGGAIAPGAPVYPGATTSVGDWVTYDSCDATADTSAPPLDLEADLAGAETTVSKWSGCMSGTSVELWSIVGASHVPDFTPAYAPDMTTWLMSKSK